MPTLSDLRRLEQLGDSLLNTHLRKVLVQVGLAYHLPPVPSLERLLQNDLLTESAHRCKIPPVSYPYRDSRRRNKAYANGFEVRLAEIYLAEGGDAAEAFIVQNHWLPHFPSLLSALDSTESYSEFYALHTLQRYVSDPSATLSAPKVEGELPVSALLEFMGLLTYSALPYHVQQGYGIYHTSGHFLQYCPASHTIQVLQASQLPANLLPPTDEEPVLRLGEVTAIQVITPEGRILGSLKLTLPWLSRLTNDPALVRQARTLLKNPAFQDISLDTCFLSYLGTRISLTA